MNSKGTACVVEFDPASFDNGSNTDAGEMEGKFLYSIEQDQNTGDIKIFPMNGDSIVLHGEVQVRNFIDHLLDYIQEENNQNWRTEGVDHMFGRHPNLVPPPRIKPIPPKPTKRKR